MPVRPASPLPPNVPTGPRNKNKYKDIDGSAPAVDGLDYGGGAGGSGGGSGAGGDRERTERGSERKERGTPDLDDRDRSSRSVRLILYRDAWTDDMIVYRKRRGSPGEREESSRSSKRR